MIRGELPIYGTVDTIDRRPSDERDLAELDAQLLDEHGRVRLLPAAAYHELDRRMFTLWCMTRGRYAIPTVELVDWITGRIGARKAIEIGSGNGDLGYHLGITETDSYQQVTDPCTMLQIASLGQRPTVPRPTVRKMEGLEAVVALAPDVVVAAWVTQFSDVPGDGNYLGVREWQILPKVREYIFVGNAAPHAKKKIFKQPHETFAFPWLVSRAADPSKNRIWVWKGGRR